MTENDSWPSDNELSSHRDDGRHEVAAHGTNRLGATVLQCLRRQNVEEASVVIRQRWRMKLQAEADCGGRELKLPLGLCLVHLPLAAARVIGQQQGRQCADAAGSPPIPPTAAS